MSISLLGTLMKSAALVVKLLKLVIVVGRVLKKILKN